MSDLNKTTSISPVKFLSRSSLKESSAKKSEKKSKKSTQKERYQRRKHRLLSEESDDSRLAESGTEGPLGEPLEKRR